MPMNFDIIPLNFDIILLILRQNARAFQKDSFWLAKGLVLHCKRTPFTQQKDYIWRAKGVLLERRGKIALMPKTTFYHTQPIPSL